MHDPVLWVVASLPIVAILYGAVARWQSRRNETSGATSRWRLPSFGCVLAVVVGVLALAGVVALVIAMGMFAGCTGPTLC